MSRSRQVKVGLRKARGKAKTASRRALKIAKPAASAAGSRLATGARALPVPHRVRVGLSKAILRRPHLVRVPVDSLLVGFQAGVHADRFAELAGDPTWPSRRVVDGPHVALLRRANENGANEQGALTDDEILATPYAQLALQCIALRGSYFGVSDSDGVLVLARHFIARYQGEAPTTEAATSYHSGYGDPILVAPVRWSECYQVLDGHHRLAIAIARGEHYVDVKVKWIPVTTPLQNLLNRMSWIGGSRELYQPIDAPELRQSWTTVRRCTDRRDKMLAFLDQRGLTPPATTTYLDVASCYGWFVNEMTKAGYDGRGIEQDPLAPQLGRAVYGLPEERIRIGDAEKLLLDQPQSDVVSCFSLLHHFVLGRASVGADELVRLLDKVTGRVLFFDTGEGHEQWFRQHLPEWNARHIEAFLREHSSFDEVINLGPDVDAIPPYEENYGRHLFACVRSDSR